jgi:hypothetical protein
MKERHDQIDALKEEDMRQLKERVSKKNNFGRLTKMSEPKINIFIGIFVSVL